MGEIETRLASCFSAVLPELSATEILHANADTVPSWDSVATVNLIMVIEDEFEIEIEIYDPSQFDSFQGILNYLRRGQAKEQVAVDFV
jgi:acyl carrier protein